jgi:16S rRNA (guanine527-N7)-methyltransferase
MIFHFIFIIFTMDFLEFWTICSANNIILSKKQIDNIERYVKELLYWNEKVNLISRKDYENVLVKHILHSLAPLKYLDIKHKARVLDVGTGGGLPGIPLKIARPDIFITLVDSIKKKTKIVEMLANHTGERNIDVIATRAENLHEFKKNDKKFDLIVTRAVASAANVLAWTKKVRKNKAIYIFYKGGDLSDEIKQAKTENKNIDISVIDIDFVGVPEFKANEKKLLICKFKN